MDVRTVVLLGVSGVAVYAAYRSPAVGVALTVGVSVLLALHLLDEALSFLKPVTLL
ncbi:hypothetical protein ACWGR4_47870 [Embleya sp. NPDC055664]